MLPVFGWGDFQGVRNDFNGQWQGKSAVIIYVASRPNMQEIDPLDGVMGRLIVVPTL